MPGQVLGRSSVNMLSSEAAPSRLYEFNPDCKVIAVLRDPTARAYSAYWYFRREGLEDSKTFEDALAREAERASDQQEALRHNLTYRGHGRYADQLERYLDLFGRERVLVFSTSELSSDPTSVCARCFEFLGVDSTFAPDVQGRKNVASMPRLAWIHNAMNSRTSWKRKLASLLPYTARDRIRGLIERINLQPTRYPRMDPATEKELRAFFEPQNARLSELLGKRREELF